MSERTVKEAPCQEEIIVGVCCGIMFLVGMISDDLVLFIASIAMFIVVLISTRIRTRSTWYVTLACLAAMTILSIVRYDSVEYVAIMTLGYPILALIFCREKVRLLHKVYL